MICPDRPTGSPTVQGGDHFQSSFQVKVLVPDLFAQVHEEEHLD
jgi:hypothetical protein